MGATVRLTTIISDNMWWFCTYVMDALGDVKTAMMEPLKEMDLLTSELYQQKYVMLMRRRKA